MLINQNNQQITTQGVIVHLLMSLASVFRKKLFHLFNDVINKNRAAHPYWKSCLQHHFSKKKSFEQPSYAFAWPIPRTFLSKFATKNDQITVKENGSAKARNKDFAKGGLNRKVKFLCPKNDSIGRRVLSKLMQLKCII